MIQRRPAGRPGDAELLAEDRVAGPLGREPLAQRQLDRPVGLGHRRQVGLGLDHQVGGPEARDRDRVGDVGELEREREVVVGVGTDAILRWLH